MPGARPPACSAAAMASITAPPSSTAVKAGRVAATCATVSRARASASRWWSHAPPQGPPGTRSPQRGDAAPFTPAAWLRGASSGPAIAPRLLRPAADVLAQPGVDGVVPEQAVRGLQHPVVLVGEVQELRLDALALQRGER